MPLLVYFAILLTHNSFCKAFVFCTRCDVPHGNATSDVLEPASLLPRAIAMGKRAGGPSLCPKGPAKPSFPYMRIIHRHNICRY